VSPARPASRIIQLVLDHVESPTFDGRAFGAVGPYEKFVGHALGEIDPADPVNAEIMYLANAPRNSRGLVEYDVDLYILKPMSLARGNGMLLYEAVNRGDKLAFTGSSMGHFNIGARGGNAPSAAPDAGDGFAMEQGYTLVWSGWQGDIQPGNGRLTARLPVAGNADGSAIHQRIWSELSVGEPAQWIGLSGSGAIRSFPAVEASQDAATLSRRASPDAVPEPLPREAWSFARCPTAATATPSNVAVCLPAGFSPDYLYDLVYEARDPLVMGLGFAAVRDLVAFLRYDTSPRNPLAPQNESLQRPALQGAIAFGASQSGRFLRDFVYQGFNQDSLGRQVFDGVIAHAAGARRTFTNAPFAMPGRNTHAVNDHHYPLDQFPFTYETLSDPISQHTDGLLVRCRAQGTCPLIMQWDTATEAWQGRYSLVVTDPLGTTDVPIPANVRLYYFASAQHAPGNRPRPGLCQQRVNPLRYEDTQRALLVALQAWVTSGAEPPPSQFPHLADTTLVEPGPQAAQGFPAVPGLRYAGQPNHLFMQDQSVLPPRHVPGTEYRVLVPRVDDDGNEVGGVRTVRLEAPLGTYTGWNLRTPGNMADELCGLYGSFVPFAVTAAERAASGDPRPSLEERYGTQEGYLEAVTAAARRLVAARFLLPADAERAIQAARTAPLGLSGPAAR